MANRCVSGYVVTYMDANCDASGAYDGCPCAHRSVYARCRKYWCFVRRHPIHSAMKKDTSPHASTFQYINGATVTKRKQGHVKDAIEDMKDVIVE